MGGALDNTSTFQKGSSIKHVETGTLGSRERRRDYSYDHFTTEASPHEGERGLNSRKSVNVVFALPQSILYEVKYGLSNPYCPQVY